MTDFNVVHTLITSDKRITTSSTSGNSSDSASLISHSLLAIDLKPLAKLWYTLSAEWRKFLSSSVNELLLAETLPENS